MQKALYSEMFLQEKTYWWHVAKRRLVQQEIKNSQINLQDKIVLDVGCGTGAMMEEMQKFGGNVFGIDGSDESITFTQKRGLKNIQKVNLEQPLPLKDSSYDYLICLDVLEHIENDHQLVAEFYRILKPGGKLLLTVPAYQFMWTYWDEVLGHKRRYRKANLIKLLKSANLKVTRASYFYSFLFPVAFVFRHVKEIFKSEKSDFVQIPNFLNQLLLLVCALERAVINYFPIPVGLSIYIQAEKHD